MDIGKRVRAARETREITQEELARRAGVPLNRVGRIETGAVTDPHYSTLSRIAGGLGLSVGELLEGKPVLAGKAEAPGAGQPVVTRQLAELVDGLAEAGNEEVLVRVWRVLEAERNRLAEMHLVDDPENPAVRGEFARAVERLAYVGLRLEALRQAPAEQGAKALVEET